MKGGDFLVVFLVELAFQLGGPGLGKGGQIGLAGELGRPGQDRDHGGLLLEAGLFVELLVGLLGQLQGKAGIGSWHCPEP